MRNTRYILIGCLHQLEKLLAYSIDHLSPKPHPAFENNAELDEQLDDRNLFTRR